MTAQRHLPGISGELGLNFCRCSSIWQFASPGTISNFCLGPRPAGVGNTP